MNVLDNLARVPTLDERIAEVRQILFLLAEAVCRNFRPEQREDRLMLAFTTLADANWTPQIERMIRRELAKC